MAGLNVESTTPANTPPTAGRLFATIAWLRWRLFVNSLRGKGAAGELIVKILSYPLLALIVFGPAIGAGSAAYLMLTNNADAYLAIPLWIIFLLWQFIGISTSASGPSFDVASLIRFPIRYRDYLLLRLSFGLLDPPTLAGLACLFAVAIAVAFAVPSLFPVAALALLLYAACNVFFSRMIYSWLERWLAQRRTRELVTGAILFVSLGIQVVVQLAQRLGDRGTHGPPNPALLKAAHIALTINWWLPPGLTTAAIEQSHHAANRGGSALLAAAALAGVAAYAAFFAFVVHIRYRAEFLGENLSEAPSAAASKAKAPTAKQAATRAAARVAPSTPAPTTQQPRKSLLPPDVSACLIKEVRYLLRSGPQLYTLIVPVFMIFVFAARTTGLKAANMPHNAFTGYLFSAGCAYALLIFVALLYNSFGNDAAGTQFYFMAPVPLRHVVLGKNLLTSAILAIEIVLMYACTRFVGAAPDPATAVATVVWTVFAFLVSMSVGNLRSLISPKGIMPGKMRRQNVSGVSSFISLLVVFGSIGIGSLIVLACHMLNTSLWAAAAAFAVLAALAFGMYLLIYRRLDSIANEHREDLMRALAKT